MPAPVPTGTERYAHGNSYCHADVAECRAYAYACSSSDSDA